MPTRSHNIRLYEGCERYVARIQNEGQAERSVYTARYALSRFRKAVGTRREPNPYVHTISDVDMDEYCFGQGGIRAGVRAVSFNRYRSVLVSFFEYAVMKGWTDENPMSGIGRARLDQPEPKLWLNATELIALSDHCCNPVERIACALGMNLGMRSNDIRRLTVFDTSLASGAIQTEIRKTKKLDVKPITMELHWALKKWLNTYAEYMGLEDRGELPGEWLLMPSYRNAAPREREQRIHLRPLQVHTNPWRMVQRPLARMGYPTKGEGFHTLRRSSARALFESLRADGAGRDHALMIVKDFLNHTNVAMTEQYLGLSQERALRDNLLKNRPFLSSLAETEQLRAAKEASHR